MNKLSTPHIEDTLFTQYKEGELTPFENYVLGKMAFSQSQKFDGAAAIVFGYKDKRLFIATKNGFESKKNPKLCYSFADIRKYYEDSDVAKILGRVFSALCTVESYMPGIDFTFAADFMYHIEDVQLRPWGDNYLVFTPNVTQYAVEMKDTKPILNSRVGIVVHSILGGSSKEWLQVFPESRPFYIFFGKVKSIAVHYPARTSVAFPKEITPELVNQLEAYRATYKEGMPESVNDLLQLFVNHCIRKNLAYSYVNLETFHKQRVLDQGKELKTEKAKQNLVEKYKVVDKLIVNNKIRIMALLSILNRFESCKYALIRDKFKDSMIQAVYHEGLLLQNITGRYKIVDRRNVSHKILNKEKVK
jgi:hypothetical protein